jgi:uncharacterized protein (TIGR02147 family)
VDESSLYSYDDYRKYLEGALTAGRFGSRGPRSKLGDAAGCQVAYVSQVLGGHAHFSIEQASGISRYLKHDEAERAYFYDLILYARAGTRDVREFFRKRLLAVRRERLELAKRLDTTSEIAFESRATYYGAWYYTAIHMLAHLPSFRTVDAITERLRLDHSLVQKALAYLVSIKVLQQRGDTYLPLESDLHLPKGSPFLAKHLFNWRIQAMLAADQHRHDGLHYSSVMTLNADDALALREILTRSIERTREITSASHNEDSVYICNVDFFEL